MIRRNFLKLLSFFLVASLLSWPGLAGAAAGPWVEKDQLRLRLIGGAEVQGAPDRVFLGLQYELEPGWKIYWRSPGDAGFPPALDWAGSENLAQADMLWPVPHRFSLFGLETFGYGKEIVFPIEAALSDPAQGAVLKAEVDYLVCEEICIPYSDELSLQLPSGGGSDPGTTSLIQEYLGQVPDDGSRDGLSLNVAELTGAREESRLLVTVASNLAFANPDVLVEGPPAFSFSKPEVSLSDDGKVAKFEVAAHAGPGAGVLEGKMLTLTVTDGLRAMEQEIIARFPEGAAPAAAGPAPAASFTELLYIGALALLGGLILNLMPCVLPVLSIKLLSVAEHGGRDRSEVRAGFLASAAGIVFSFLVLAGFAIALKTAGMAVGWGIQFQQPLFLSAMVLIVSLFAFNLFGLFEIPLPAWLGGLATSGSGKGIGGHFATGAFATLLATPCSAPFLGTAIGFALSHGASEILLIFALLGVGMGIPYLAVAAFPGLAAGLPKPGAWMLWLRRLMGLALAATAVWLLTVLAAQIGAAAALGAGLLLLGLGLVLWFGAGQALQEGTRRLATPALGTLLAVAVVALPLGFGSAGQKAAEDGAAWPVLDEPRIAELVAQGQTVFVDVTADWCITCQVNKKVVLDSETVEARLNGADVALMRGDWTNPSDEISAYLRRFERYGIPFNAVYGPAAPDGIALPEILTEGAVLEALEKAAGS